MIYYFRKRQYNFQKKTHRNANRTIREQDTHTQGTLCRYFSFSKVHPTNYKRMSSIINVTHRIYEIDLKRKYQYRKRKLISRIE